LAHRYFNYAMTHIAIVESSTARPSIGLKVSGEQYEGRLSSLQLSCFKVAPEACDIALWWRPEMPLILAAEM